ncbi:hypothetical protein QJS04_geneDACA005344 [Acorus gramineus]|uniref:CARD domain-containing protein n=1 Tax=Acorus gramineus TaxID=55184 RepID=A0AAV9B0N6_ACOGR|nr:hypothetical protein QJS04_geneDACA005344 [Acorus gramineus]
MVPRSMDSIYTCLSDDDDSCSSDDDDDDSCSYSRNHTPPTGSTPPTTDTPPTMYVPPAVIELEKKREQCPVFLDHLKNLDITWFSTLEDVKKKITLSEDQCCYLETEDKEHIIKKRLRYLEIIGEERLRSYCQELILEKIHVWVRLWGK